MPRSQAGNVTQRQCRHSLDFGHVLEQASVPHSSIPVSRPTRSTGKQFIAQARVRFQHLWISQGTRIGYGSASKNMLHREFGDFATAGSGYVVDLQYRCRHVPRSGSIANGPLNLSAQGIVQQPVTRKHD